MGISRLKKIFGGGANKEKSSAPSQSIFGILPTIEDLGIINFKERVGNQDFRVLYYPGAADSTYSQMFIYCLMGPDDEVDFQNGEFHVVFVNCEMAEGQPKDIWFGDYRSRLLRRGLNPDDYDISYRKEYLEYLDAPIITLPKAPISTIRDSFDREADVVEPFGGHKILRTLSRGSGSKAFRGLLTPYYQRRGVMNMIGPFTRQEFDVFFERFRGSVLHNPFGPAPFKPLSNEETAISLAEYLESKAQDTKVSYLKLK